MTLLHDLKPVPGSKRARRRVGRGISSGQGKTAGRGTKGYGARSGSGGRLYREGGNLPFIRRLPFKRGFTNIHKTVYVEVNVDEIDDRFASGDKVDPETLAAVGFFKDARDGPVVVLGRGKITKKLTVRAHRFSKSAREKIEAAGGSVELLAHMMTPAVDLESSK